MSQSDQQINRIRNLVMVLIVGLYLGFCVWSIVTTRHWVGRNFPGFLVIRHNYVSTLYFSSWAGFQNGIRNLDKVVEINGRPVSTPRELYDFVLTQEPGTPVTYTLLREGKQVEKAVPVSVFTLGDYILCFPVAMLLGLFFCGSGLFVLYLKPRAPPAWYILLGFVSIGVLYGANGERCTEGVNFLPNIFMPMMGLPMLLFSFYFPFELKLRRLYVALVFAVMMSVDVMYIRAFLTDINFIFYDRLYLQLTFLGLLISVSIQVYSYLRTDDQVAKQKAKVAILGFVLCFLVGIVLYFGAIVPKRNNFFFTSIPAAIIPISLGYAVVKHNLFDVDVFIRRSITYILLSGIVVVLFFGLGTLLSLGLQDFTGQSSRIATVASTFVIVLLFNPLRARIDRTIDRRFFRERYEYTATIRKASSLLVSIIDLDELLQQLLGTVMEAIKIERGVILIRSDDDGRFRSSAAAGFEGLAPNPDLSADHPFLAQIESARKAVQRNDVEELAEFETDRMEKLAVIEELGVVLTIPIIYERRLIGLLGLGEKKSGAWYSTEDMELLTTLMMQTAISIENARKIVELRKMIELETSYRELQKLDEMKDDFLSMVSHDLRTPMTSIKGYATLLNAKAGKLDEDRQKHFTSIIMQECDRLTRLINNLLDLQRLEAGRMQLELGQVDLVELCRSATASFRGSAMTKRIELSDEFPSQPVMVKADGDRISQVISNLLSNALKFTPEDGAVEAKIEVFEDDGSPWARLSITDNGPGIPPEAQAALFDKFRQVKGIESQEQGSGLGLALVRETVKEHGGSVGVESEPGRGSTFYFTLEMIEGGDGDGQENSDRG